MADFSRKTRDLNRSTTLQSGYVPEMDPFAMVSTLDGSRLRIPATQIPRTSPYENSNLYRYAASGNYTNILNTGGGLQIFLTRSSGSGPLTGPLYLRLQVFNPNGSTPAYFLPAPFWLQNIQYFTPSGAPVAVQDGQGIFHNITEVTETDNMFELEKAIITNPSFGKGDPILPLQTANIYIPLIGNPLSCGKFLIAATQGDFQVLCNFFAASVFQLSGPACNLVNATIETPQAQLSDTSLSTLIREYKLGKHDWFFPYERVMTLTQNWNASSSYQVPLSGLAGDMTFVRFGLYPSLTGLDLAAPVPISSFQFQNNAGEPISGMQVIESDFNRFVMQPQYFEGKASRRTKKYAYVWSKNSTGAMELLLKGTKYGSYPFTNKESLIINTAPAGTNEVVTITPSSAPASGTFQLCWTNPEMSTVISAPIAFNATAATIQSTINNLLNFTGSCTVTGTMATSVVVTFNGGGYQNRPLNADGFCLSVITNSLIGVTYTVGVSSVVTTPGVNGITSGSSYVLKIWGYTTSVGHQLTDGSVESQNSG